MTDTDELIKAFNDKHGLDTDGQFRQLAEEVGELAEAINRDEDVDSVVEECADVCFVARSIALLHDDVSPGVPELALESKSEYNLYKSTDVEGTKVTDDVEEL